jgi:hypothetical protein
MLNIAEILGGRVGEVAQDSVHGLSVLHIGPAWKTVAVLKNQAHTTKYPPVGEEDYA